MPITRSAKKALRSSVKKREANLARKDKVARALKVVKKLINENKKKEALLALRDVQSALDKAVKEKTLNKNTASRKTSRLSKQIKKL
ncbi:MAG: ribosomal protein S20 [Parcubacteria bacterium C7867-005]|nr:MAG: ribosomal protein S20 [Parcubacteria bacterium C7867-005]